MLPVVPYDVELKAQPASYRRVWGAWVIERLRRELGTLTGVRLEVHAGDAYAEALCEPARAVGAKLIRPLQGLMLGEQLAWYLSHSGLLPDPTLLPAAVSGAVSGAEDRTGATPRSERVDDFVTRFATRPSRYSLPSWKSLRSRRRRGCTRGGSTNRAQGR